MVACAILLFHLATTQRFFDSETMFGLFSSQLSEIFWEMIELLNEKCGDKLDLSVTFLQSRVELYADAFKDSEHHYKTALVLFIVPK